MALLILKKMIVRNEISINKDAREVWQVIGNQFADIHVWASFFKDSKPAGESKFPGINFSARDTVVENGENTHTLDVFDSENHILTYTVTAGAPPFANKAEATWALVKGNNKECRASIDVNMDLKEMVPAEKVAEVRQWLKFSADNMLGELKHYVETGELHPRKLK
jgi:hypothetical protein